MTSRANTVAAITAITPDKGTSQTMPLIQPPSLEPDTRRGAASGAARLLDHRSTLPAAPDLGLEGARRTTIRSGWKTWTVRLADDSPGHHVATARVARR